MKDYSKGKIYAIRNYINHKAYVGSTIETLERRFSKHGCSEKESNYPLCIAMKELGRKHFYIELIENYPCSSKQELHAREGYWIRQMKTYKNGYNKLIAGRTAEEYYKDNKDIIKQRVQSWVRDNKEKRNEYVKEYSNKHRDKIIEYSRKYYHENKDKLLAYSYEKVDCECGSTTMKHNLYRHLKTKKHQTYITNRNPL